MTDSEPGRHVPALRVRQWLPEWSRVRFDKASRRARPEDHFYVFSIDASLLRRLSGVYPRSISGGTPRAQDLGIQRRFDQKRSRVIGQYVKFGYPWSELRPDERSDAENRTLRKPGWLATAIVVNAMAPGETRPGGTLSRADAVVISDDGPCGAQVTLPAGVMADDWTSPSIPPLEIIDGQHRLLAFDENGARGFELPVVAFRNLDRSWQAYLFWVINIKPQRINPSLAFDLYPLLRAEDWLERPAEQDVYRKTRAQELVEALWSHPKSPWHMRINMLGERGQGPMVSQAAWVQSLISTFVKASTGRGVRIGGLFGGRVGPSKTELEWNRTQQAAFLIYLWRELHGAVRSSKAKWTQALRGVDGDGSSESLFFGPHSLLSTDQGVRGVLAVANDLAFLASDDLQLNSWRYEPQSNEEAIGVDAINGALASIARHGVGAFVRDLSSALAEYDWRRLSAPKLSKRQTLEKAALRGSGGYRILRQQLLEVVTKGQLRKYARAAGRYVT